MCVCVCVCVCNSLPNCLENDFDFVLIPVSGDASICSLPKDPGPCRGYNPVWYFEPVTRTCRRFLYGGCQGNDNRFDSREKCQERCLSAKPAMTTAVLTTTTTQQTVVDTEDNLENILIPGSSGAELPTDDDTGKLTV